MPEVSPEEVLALIEGQAQLASVLDGLKVNLEHLGWSSVAAEQASIATMVPLLLANMIASR